MVAAGGVGSRIDKATPKQYLEICGKPIIWHSVVKLVAQSRLNSIVVLVANHDQQASAVLAEFGDRVLIQNCGGPTRAATVANGLARIDINPADIIVVHDAARPCLHQSDLTKLLDVAENSPDGALLATPLAGTIKRATAGVVSDTIDRSQLWEAQTPQAFPAELLETCLAAFPDVSDEAQAIEKSGKQPLLVASEYPNLKITFPADLEVATALLSSDKR